MARTSYGAVERASIAAVCVLAVGAIGAWSGTAFGHGKAVTEFRATVVSIEPSTVPIQVSVAGGDTLRVENAGSSKLELCESGAASPCRAFVRIDDSGVFVRPKSRLLKDAELPPTDSPDGTWLRVRREPRFFSYHDPRMSIDVADVADEVDEGDPRPQPVSTFDVPFRYGDVDGVATVHMEYVGGRRWLSRYGEQALTASAITAMLVAFLIDARRRRRADVPQESHLTP